MSIRRFVVVLGLMVLSCTSKAATEVQSFTLDNGLKVVVHVDDRLPIVAMQLWYKVGSQNEHLGLTGVSHMLEHMMFQGTKSQPDTKMMNEVAVWGGSINAFTSQDMTVYQATVAKDRLDTLLAYEADRMQNLQLDNDKFEKELQVVMEERRMRVDDNPDSLVSEQLLATTLFSSPYSTPTVGWMSDLESMTRQDLEQWYKTWYQPNQAILVLSGDVSMQTARQMVDKHFAPIPSGPTIVSKPIPKVAAMIEQRLNFSVPHLTLDKLRVAYKVPSAVSNRTSDPYALAVLATILDGGLSSRFQQHLIREQEVAVSASAYYDLYAQHPYLFMLSAVPAPGESLGSLEAALLGEMALIQTEGPTDAEMQKAKNQLLSETVFARDGVTAMAGLIGNLETQGLGWAELEAFISQVKSVTAAQVQAVASTYFTSNNRTIAYLEKTE